jgi:hypothetical protein
MFLPRMDLVWFDIQIDQRIATLKANIFVGHNLGRNHYKMGFICLIGIAHLTETLTTLRFNKMFELRPTLSTDLNPLVEDELTLSQVPDQAKAITKNLFCAIKTVAAQILHRIPICGNVAY